jgi:hypothetical protein
MARLARVAENRGPSDVILGAFAKVIGNSFDLSKLDLFDPSKLDLFDPSKLDLFDTSKLDLFDPSKSDSPDG